MVTLVLKLLLFYLLFLLASTVLRVWRTYRLVKAQMRRTGGVNAETFNRAKTNSSGAGSTARTQQKSRPSDIEAEYRVVRKNNEDQ